MIFERSLLKIKLVFRYKVPFAKFLNLKACSLDSGVTLRGSRNFRYWSLAGGSSGLVPGTTLIHLCPTPMAYHLLCDEWLMVYAPLPRNLSEVRDCGLNSLKLSTKINPLSCYIFLSQ